MAYTTINKGSNYFNTVLWTGNGIDNTSITGVGFQPDFVWVKERNGTEYHNLVDVVRGSDKLLFSNVTNAEVTDANRIESFDSDGFTIGTDSAVNTSSDTYASWNWKANGAGVSNTDGSITSTVSANTTSGFSIVGWTGTGANGTIGHGLGTAPAMIIVKARGAVKDWMVGYNSLGWTKYINLNTTSGESTASTVWQDTAPTSSVFSVGSSSDVNTSSTTMIAYCFAEKKGFSKFGKYTGNGSATDGTFIYTAFKPAFVITKRIDTTENWAMFDNKRDGFNVNNRIILANFSDAENTTNTYLDLLSNGFKTRSTSGATYIAYCFAEKKGFSKFGKYTGNGSATDGTFVYTGFKPAFVMVKRSDGVVNWQLIDNKRSDAGGNNIIDKVLAPNVNDAEYDEGSSTWCGDLLSNGFKWRGDWGALNASGGNYIYMAFAENPLVGTNNIPTTAR